MLSEERNSFRPKDLHLLKGVSDQVAVAVANILADEKIEQQLKEINGYKEKLEEEKLYLQQEISSVYTYTDIIGAGPEMQRVFHMLSQVSFAQSTVLILGETGTGKELIARAIHNASPRKSKLMVKVNCAALPANLIESELFGHERGSFTGAVERRIGKFELANHGTLFLDEIGEMPLDLQVKLLRAIQEKEIERIGGKSTIKTDVRIIAATNRNLQKEVAEGRFRSDLFYRLNVFPIVLPPLRDRKEDISLLAAHFMERFARSAGRKNVRLSSTAMKQLTAYNWPGNVRELEHVLERSILLTQGNVIREINLSSQPKSDHKVQPEEDYTRTFEEMERDYILGVLNKCKGKVFGPGGAAEILGMHVSTLNHRIKKLGIRKEQTYYIRKP
ncbi:sigma 54-interacting transcriptional regulator [Chitinophaga sp. B61]|uniref:Sigma 54-interacting transcriptional regulator n=2 Tax=Chitinophaga rhizophila TaxID=2866212 RepID=A0ABS7GMV0_9BACT|nr:sigma 54-interacting transcriptional regulator [Chitinophaga rhizophila]